MRGLARFRNAFERHANQYVLIGGTAATLAMESAGLSFRATKDLDVVLHIEVLDAAFGAAFWRFIEAGAYELRQQSTTGKQIYYRFQRPGDESYPAMLELFSRAPAGMVLGPDARLTPIPISESVASLSAILLDNDYYDFVIAGRRVIEGLPWVGEDRLIPLKAVAWLDMTARAQRGELIDSRDIRKHAYDILRLSQLLAPDTRITAAPKIVADLHRFLDAVGTAGLIDPHALGLGSTLTDLIDRIRAAYR